MEQQPRNEEQLNNTENSEDEVFKNLGDATVEKPKRKKYGWVGYVLLCIVIGLSIWMMLEIVMVNTDEYKSLSEVFAGGDWRFALISLGVLLVTVACMCLEYVIVIKAVTGKTRIGTGMKVALLGKFYDYVTPFATGGQPMQIYYLHKKGFSGGVSTAVVLVKYFVWMICWLVTGLILMACNVAVLDRLDTSYRVLILVLGWVGIGINMLLPLAVLMFAVLPKFANKVASLVVGAGHKIKIVKDKEKTLQKANKFVSDFRSCFKIISKKPLYFIMLIVTCVLEVFLTFALPYFIMRAYSGVSGGIETMLSVSALNCFVIFGVALIPTPGNTGAMEGLGALAFSAFVTGSVQFWSMFTWRFAVYYIFIVIGLGFTVFDFIRKIIISRKQRSNKDE